MKKNIFFDYQMDENTRPYQQRSFIAIIRVLIICTVLLLGFVLYASAGVSSTNSRTGLYNKSAEKAESAAVIQAEASGLYSPLRANPATATSGIPTPDEGIGVGTPIGDATGMILLAGVAYLGFVLIRKRRNDLKTQ